MKSALINEFGGPDVIVEGEARLRQPQANDVVVRIEAASVNPLDVKILAGYMQPIFPVEFPYAPGTDFSGVIESVGEQVSDLKTGDRVLGRASRTWRCVCHPSGDRRLRTLRHPRADEFRTGRCIADRVWHGHPGAF
ncbi:alcohol dehydrogenase catalytic domain-containing protein [Pseudomonas mediterranea]